MKQTILTRFVLVATVTAGLIACGGREGASTSTSTDAASAGSGKALSVKGSDTMVIMTQRLSEEYMKVHPSEVVQVNGGGSGTGIAALINGTTDLAQASRPMKAAEIADTEKQRGSKVVETAIALDALAVFVHATNPVKELTVAQIGDIYTGKTKNWKELGGPDKTIIMYGRESSSGTYDYFKEHVLSKKDFAPAVQTLQGTAAIINAVSKDPNGVGYGGIAYSSEVRALSVKADAATPAVAPGVETVADSTYPLSRKLFFYSLQNAPERVTKFIEYCLTAPAQELVTTVGYFPIATNAGSTTETSATSTSTTAPDAASTATASAN